MKRIAFLLALSTGLIMAGCKDSKKQAIEFNNKLSAISDSLYSRGKVVGGEINKAITSREFSSIAVAPFGNLKPDCSQEELQGAINNLMDKSKDEASYMQKLKTAQQEYAKKNKFEVLEKTKM